MGSSLKRMIFHKKNLMKGNALDSMEEGNITSYPFTKNPLRFFFLLKKEIQTSGRVAVTETLNLPRNPVISTKLGSCRSPVQPGLPSFSTAHQGLTSYYSETFCLQKAMKSVFLLSLVHAK